MTHRILKVKEGFHYARTEVSFESSLQQIRALLNKHGCSRIAEMSDNRGERPIHTLAWEKDGIPFMVEFPVTYTASGKLNMAISGRIVFNRIKSMLIEVEIDLWSFVQAMSPFLALPGRDGKPEPMYEYVEEHRAELTSHTQIFPQLEGRKA